MSSKILEKLLHLVGDLSELSEHTVLVSDMLLYKRKKQYFPVIYSY